MKSPERRQIIERAILIGLLFLIQIIWFFVIFANIINYSVWINVIFTIISLILILYLIRKNESPAYRMGWISLMAMFPLLGGLLYLLIGNKRPTRRMKRRLNEHRPLFQQELQTLPHQPAQAALAERDLRVASLSHYIYQFESYPLYRDTQVEYFANGESMMNQLIQDLKAAKSYIFLEFFIVEFGQMFDQIFEVLKEKVGQGVEVRLIYDDFGCIARLPEDFDRQCEAVGIKAIKFNPVHPVISMVYNTRDHRKYIIIDGLLAYTGGLNIADEYINVKQRFGYWKDNMIRLNGPASWSLSHLFLEMWNGFYPEKDMDLALYRPQLLEQTNPEEQNLPDSTSFVQPFGDSPLDNEAVGENVYRQLLDMAIESVYIYTPYLIISYEMQTALELAAKRGVDVRIVTPGIPDKPVVYRMTRSFYRPLLEAGVRIYEFTPGFLHAKTFIVDGKVACVGTINLDYRSLYLHFETGTLLYYHPVIEQISEDFFQVLDVSRERVLNDLNQSFFGEIVDSLLRLFAPFV